MENNVNMGIKKIPVDRRATGIGKITLLFVAAFAFWAIVGYVLVKERKFF